MTQVFGAREDDASAEAPHTLPRRHRYDNDVFLYAEFSMAQNIMTLSRDFDWTPMRIRKRRAMSASGATYTEIADALGTTRDTVANQAHRERALGSAGDAWTDERIALLRKLWAESLSASQIAGRLGGVTRNAVIGKVHRLGLSKRVTASRLSRKRGEEEKKAALKAEAAAEETRRVEALEQVKRQHEALARLSEPAPVVAEGPARDGFILLDLKESMCRFPVGDPLAAGFHFCGELKTKGSSYCSRHHKLCWQPVSRKTTTTSQVGTHDGKPHLPAFIRGAAA
jgi:GcrA cell cycle regulator